MESHHAGAERHRTASSHGLALGLEHDHRRRVSDRERDQAAGDASQVVGNDNRIVAGIDRLNVGDRIGRVGGVGNRCPVEPPLIIQVISRGRHAEGRGAALNHRLALRLNRDGRRSDVAPGRKNHQPASQCACDHQRD